MHLDTIVILNLGAVFIFAFVAKIIWWTNYSQSFQLLFEWLPGLVRRPMLPIVPGLEGTLGVTLITGFAQTYVLILATGMLVFFTIILIGNLRQGYSTSCGCFGPEVDALTRGKRAIVRNIVLIGLAAFALLPFW